MLEQALGYHRAGRLDAAETIYRQILAGDSRHADSLHLLGMIQQQRGDLETAVSLIRRAIEIDPNAAAFHSNLGTVLQAQGKLEEAGACFEHALALKPDWAEVLSNFGNVLQAQGRLDEAATRQQRAIALKPQFAEAWSNLGIVRQAQGDLREAVKCYERAIALKPDYVDAHNNLGTALLNQDRVEEAAVHYERALALNPSYASAHNNLGNALVRQNRSDEAQAHYERAIELQPGYANAHNNLGNVLKEQGRFEDAMAHYDKALAIRPDYAEAHLNRADMRRFTRDASGFAALEALAKNNDLPEDKALFVHFALAKALDDVAEYDRAFEHLLLGNQLKRRQIDYHETRALDLMRRIRKVFDAELLDRSKTSGDPSPAPIFVLGMARSGSTLIEQILAGHPQIQAAGELTILEKMESRDFPESIARSDDAALVKLGQTYLSRLPKLSVNKLRVIDKLPGNFLRAGLIRLMLPNAKIIHTTRNPVDTCLSCFFKLFTNGLFFSYDLGELGRYYRGYRELMDHWRAVLAPGVMLDVAYEKVVNDIEDEARRLVDFCGLTWDRRCIDFHHAARPVRTASAVQVRQPLYRSSLERWRRYESRLGPLMEALGTAAV
jgi:tetratricopeptide (TPR) repeat protein